MEGEVIIAELNVEEVRKTKKSFPFTRTDGLSSIRAYLSD
jgi:hypothetical protein